jgi:hypothetical protein
VNQSFKEGLRGAEKENNTHQHTTHKKERREGGDSEEAPEAIA